MQDNIQIGVNEIVNQINVTPSIIDQTVDIGVTDNSYDVVLNIENRVVQVNIIKGLNASDVVTSINGENGDVIIDKATLGLGNVDNTSDLNKPISTATQTALDGKQPLDGDLTSIAGLTGTSGILKKNGVNSWNLDNTTYLSSITSNDVTTALGFTPENAANKGINNGYASLGGDGKVPSSQLPSYVDDVIEVANLVALPVTGENGKIYVTLDTNKIYRWTGNTYIEISPSVGTVWGSITGTLSNQADLQTVLSSKAPIDSPAFTGTVSGITKGMVGLGNVDNTSDLNKPISTATQTALNAKQPLDADLTSIAALTDSFGLLKKTANNTYTIDTNTYLTGITSNDVTTALGYTPENLANKGANNGYASLGNDGKVPSSQLPSYADDVIEVSSFSTLPTTGETGKIYVTIDTNKIYRWTNSTYVELSASATAWGSITGTISNQTDLRDALNAKENSVTAGTTLQYYRGDKTFQTLNTSVVPEGSNLYFTDARVDLNSNVIANTAARHNAVTLGTANGLSLSNQVLSLGLSTGSVSGALSSVDWTTFNNKQSALSGTGFVKASGSMITYDPTDYYPASNPSGYTANTGTVTSVGALTLGTTGTDLSSSVSNGTTTPVITLNVPTASATNRGALSSADWTTFNSKQAALGYTAANDSEVVKLTGTQSIAGQKTFTGNFLIEQGVNLKQDGQLSFNPGYNLIDANATSIIFGLPNGTSIAHFDISNLTQSRYYNLPNYGGTIALTSDIPSLSGYVPTSRTITINGTTFDLSQNRTYTIPTNSGTVTSVALTVPSAFNVSGSPITSSGTLAITAAGDTTQYIAGDGSLVTFPTIGIAGTLIREVRNTTGATLTKGTVVYISGATGNKPTVSKALATGDSTSAQTFGLVQADIANNANGNVVCVGDLTGLDTSAFTEGAQLYLSSTTAGTYTTTKQLAPNHLVYIGVVTRSHPTQGQIEVNIQNGYELYELHDVSITSEVNNQGLFYEASTGLWKNKSIATVLGYTPANDANVVHTTGAESISGVKTFTTAVHSNILKFSESGGFNQTPGYTQIGGTADYFTFANGGNTKSAQFTYGTGTAFNLPSASGTLALTSQLHNAVTIGTANGLSLSTQVLSLGLASTSTTGALSSTDWNTFNGKQNALTNPVTGTGTTSYLPKFTGTSAIGNSLLYDTGSVLLVGATSASDSQSKLELVSAGPTGLKIISSAANGNNTFLSIQSSKEWRFLTNRGDLIGGNQGDLIIRNNTDGINHIILNQGGSTTFAGALTGTTATLSNTASNKLTLSGGSTQNALTLSAISGFGNSFYLFNGDGGLGNGFGIYNITTSTLPFFIANGGAATFSSSVTATSISTVFKEGFIVQATTTGGGGSQPAYTYYTAAGSKRWSSFLNVGDDKFHIAGSANTELFTIQQNGNVGIGTTSPSEKLYVQGKILGIGKIFAQRESNGADTLIQFKNEVGADRAYIKFGGTNEELAFYSGSGSSEHMRITSGGNVGIGTTPSSNWGSRSVLQLGGFGTSLSGFNGGGGATNLSHNAIANSFNFTYLINGGATTQYMDGSDIAWANAPVGTAGTAITFTERMRITSGGDLIFTGQSSSKIQFYNAYSGSPANVGIALFNTAGSTVMALNANGGGIFTASLGTGIVYSSGGSLTSTNPSDIRLKKNIQNISYGLADIMKLRPVSYNWETDNINQGIQFGFIAQEVQEIMPDAIKEFGEETKFLGLEKDAIYATLVNAIKELKAEIDTLKNK